jgi:hypothetical protein
MVKIHLFLLNSLNAACINRKMLQSNLLFVYKLLVVSVTNAMIMLKKNGRYLQMGGSN